LLLVDITWAIEPSGGASILTHGLGRVGRHEELFLSCSRLTTSELDLIVALVDALVTDPNYELPPSGDTIGRDAAERIPVRREPNPTGSGLPVVHLDLTSTA